ncbi:thioredoxin domain-containing protein [Candidatus Kaiserbacteria bacterium]|nr:thioredoxin domain-containing protein [Candidatus Kaiserbacteria bacterium]NCT02255.1 thioredoxin domain-containing protein [Candidatus Parcubacteria bacterium]
MQEQNNTSPQTSKQTTDAVGPQSSLLKDFAIPLSIVTAGVFIGAGLYFGGSTPAAAPTQAVSLESKLLTLAQAAGANKKDFTSCLEKKETLALVQEDTNNAVSTGGQGTPWAIIVGPSGKKYSVSGALPQATIEQMIALAMAEGESPVTDSAAVEALENMTPVNDGDHIKGNLDAKVVVVEYSDFDCPFCARFHATLNAIVKKYPATDVAWVYRHFPLEQLHPNAETVAVAAECVAKLEGNEAFWKFADSYLK